MQNKRQKPWPRAQAQCLFTAGRAQAPSRRLEPAPARLTWISLSLSLSERENRAYLSRAEGARSGGGGRRCVRLKARRIEMKTTTPRSRCRVRGTSAEDPDAGHCTITKLSGGAGARTPAGCAYTSLKGWTSQWAKMQISPNLRPLSSSNSCMG